MALTNTQIVTNDYADILFDTTSANAVAGIAGYVVDMNLYPATFTPTVVAGLISHDPEANIVEYVYSLYSSILPSITLNSAADVAGLKYWVQQVETIPGLETAAQIASGTISAAAESFLDQSFINAAGTSLTAGSSALVAQLYLQALGNGAPSTSGFTYWVNQYNSWVSSYGAAQAEVLLVNSFANAAVSANSANIATLLATAAGTDTGSGATYTALSQIPVPGQTVTLTTGVDNVAITSGNNNTINGTQATITALDSINLGSTTGNVFNVTDIATEAQDAAGTSGDAANFALLTSVSGVQTLNYTSANDLNLGVLNVSGWTGLTAANLTLNDVGEAIIITAATTTAVTLTETALDFQTSVVGGSAVTINSTGAGGEILVNGAAGNASITDSGAAAATLEIEASSGTDTIVATGVTTAGQITVTGATNTVNVTLTELATETTNTADAINITGGTVDTVVVNLTGALNNTITGGVVTVDGTSATTSVSVWQTAAATAAAKVAGVADGAVNILDASYNTTTANTITSVTLSNYGNSTIKDNALSTLSLSGTAGTLSITNATAANATPTTTNATLNLTVNGLSGANTITDTNNEYTTLNITAGATASSIAAIVDTGATALNVSGNSVVTIGTVTGDLTALKTVAITGAAGLNADLSGVGTITSITANSSGVTTVTVLPTQETFTGGTGQDIVSIGANATKAITGGTASNNEIVLNNLAAASYTSLANVTGFEILGINGTTGSTSGTIDVSKLTGFTSFDVKASGGNIAFINAAANSGLTIEANNANVITLQTVDTAGASDTAALVLGTSTNASTITVQQVTLEDSIFDGTGTVNVSSNNTTTTPANNVISVFGDNGVSTLNLSGTAGLTIGGTWTDTAATLLLNNTSAGTSLSITSLTDNSMTALTLNGTGSTLVTGTLTANALTSLTINDSAAVTINNLTSTSTTLTINDNDAAAVGITTFNDTALTSATFANNSNTKALTIGAQTEAALATLTLTNDVVVTIAGDAVTTGITVTGGSDNGVVSFTSVGATAKGDVDSVTLGTGGDTVVLGAGVAGSTQDITLGASAANASVTTSSVATVAVTIGAVASGVTDSVTTSGVGVTATVTSSDLSGSTFGVTAAGAGDHLTITTGAGTDTVTAAGAGDKGTITFGAGADTLTAVGGGDTLTITAGNGANTITVSGAANTLSVNVGTGANTITLGAGDTDSVIVGAHTGIDNVVLGASGTSTSAFVTIQGLNNAKVDTITFSDANALTGFTQVTGTEVNLAILAGTSGNTTSLSTWVAVADGSNHAASGVAGAAHSITWFQFQGNTYVYESVAGATADAGTAAAGNTLVELVGTGYTFANTTGAGGVLHLLG